MSKHSDSFNYDGKQRDRCDLKLDSKTLVSGDTSTSKTSALGYFSLFFSVKHVRPNLSLNDPVMFV